MQRRYVQGLALLVTLAPTLAPVHALAGPPSGVTVAPATVDEAPVDAASVDAEVAKAVAELVDVTAAAPASACADASCAKTLASDTGVGHVITAAVTKHGPDHRVTMTLWKGSESVAQVEDTCELCGAAELLQTVGAAARAIGTKADQLTRPGTLALSISPAGAEVTVDGEVVDPSKPLSLLPGEHLIEVSRDGYQNASAQAQVVAGVEERVDITLTRANQLNPGGPDSPGAPLRIAGYAGLGLGAAALATGITLIALEERPITSECTGENVDADGDCKFRYATLESGIAFAVGGGIVLAGAIALIVVGHKRKKTSNVRVSASPTGLYLSGWF